jgi:hypothetical protein
MAKESSAMAKAKESSAMAAAATASLGAAVKSSVTSSFRRSAVPPPPPVRGSSTLRSAALRYTNLCVLHQGHGLFFHPRRCGTA